MHQLRTPRPENSDLVEACRRGDRDALQQVLSAHAPYLERLLSRIAGPADVEDLLQMTSLAAIRAFPRFRGEAQVRTWLSRIAVRTAYEQLRKPERKRRAAGELFENELRDPSAGPERQATSRERIERLNYHLDQIGPKKRIAFVLHVFEGRPMEEVAALMDAGVSATKSRVFWARRELMRRARRDAVLRELVEPEEQS